MVLLQVYTCGLAGREQKKVRPNSDLHMEGFWMRRSASLGKGDGPCDSITHVFARRALSGRVLAFVITAEQSVRGRALTPR